MRSYIDQQPNIYQSIDSEIERFRNHSGLTLVKEQMDSQVRIFNLENAKRPEDSNWWIEITAPKESGSVDVYLHGFFRYQPFRINMSAKPHSLFDTLNSMLEMSKKLEN